MSRSQTLSIRFRQRNFALHQHLWLDCVSEWDEVPSDDEDKVIKEDESKYVCSYEHARRLCVHKPHYALGEEVFRSWNKIRYGAAS